MKLHEMSKRQIVTKILNELSPKEAIEKYTVSCVENTLQIIFSEIEKLDEPHTESWGCLGERVHEISKKFRKDNYYEA